MALSAESRRIASPACAAFVAPGWRGRLAVIAAGMCAFFTMYVTQGLLPSLQGVFHASVAELSLTITFTTLAVALAAPFSGSLSDRFGRKPVLLVSLAGLGLSTLLAATADSLYTLLAWRLLEGLFIPGVFTATVAYIGEEWEPAQMPAVTALYISGSVAGGFGGRFIAGMVTAHWGWHAAFVVLGAVTLLFLLFIAMSLPPSRRFRPSASLRASLAGLPRHLRNPKLLGTYAIGFGILFSQVCTFTYVSFHLAAAPYSLDLRQISLLFTVYLVGMVATPLAGRLAWRFGQRKVFAWAMAVSSLGMLLTLLPALPDIVLGLTLSSAGVFIAQSMATSQVPGFARQDRSSAVGLYVMCYYVGGSIGAFGPSVVWAHAGWPGCVGLVLVMQAMIAAVAWKLWRAKPGDARLPLPGADAAPALSDLQG
ncbi:MFS transporter [Thiomonas delicata]|uniref:Putative transporter MFS type n=1 Tax=Thiomonas delicata TaxID=364030 RepID=A0A238D5J5_THIDL|nr:MFS transporter [Thiomonas delicata]SBP88440.1 putative transporter MFS type [Thiomonas delicata]